MLIAWARGKKGRNQNGYEDEILSSVFGPLRYFQSEQQIIVIETILAQSFYESPAKVTANKKIDKCEIEFWPNIASKGRIEPDIRVLIRHVDKSETLLLIEAKWNAPQHEGQLHDQWVAATKQENKSREVLHIYLTRKPHDFNDMKIKEDSAHKDCLVSLTWSRLANILRSLNYGTDAALINYVFDVQDFLTKEGHAPFCGISAVFHRHQLGNTDWNSKWTFQPLLIRVSNADCYEHVESIALKNKWQFKKNGDIK